MTPHGLKSELYAITKDFSNPKEDPMGLLQNFCSLSKHEPGFWPPLADPYAYKKRTSRLSTALFPFPPQKKGKCLRCLDPMMTQKPYMRAFVATANLLQHVEKIIMGFLLTVYALHSEEGLTLIILSTPLLADWPLKFFYCLHLIWLLLAVILWTLLLSSLCPLIKPMTARH